MPADMETKKFNQLLNECIERQNDCLDLSNIDLSSPGRLKQLMSALDRTLGLRILYLNKCNINDQIFTALGNKIFSVLKLQSLSLIGNLITDQGIKNISDVLTANRYVTDLFLAGNSLTGQSTWVLLRATAQRSMINLSFHGSYDELNKLGDGRETPECSERCTPSPLTF